MIFTIIVYGAPYSTQAPYSAYQFVQSALSQGHKVLRVFFYYDGALNGSCALVGPQDDDALPDSWQKLKRDHGIELTTCIGASIKRGVINAKESKRYNKSHDTLNPEFELGGLGQLAEAMVKSDRVVTFGAAA